MMLFPTDKRTVEFFRDALGREPAREWLDSVKDPRLRNRIERYISQLESKNFGDQKKIKDGKGVWELRLHFGPGYRIYYAEDGPYIVVVLCAGHKGTQKRDIKRAKQLWVDYLKQKDI